MKLLTKKGIAQKIIIAIVIVICCNFTIPNISSAGFGGLLLEPFTDLVTTIGDTILSAFQNFLYNGKWNVGDGMANLLLGANYFLAAQEGSNPLYPDMVLTEEEAEKAEQDDSLVKIDESDFDGVNLYDGAAFFINPVVGGAKLIAKVTGVQKGYLIPTVQYSIDKIFAGEIPAFDVNFINPKQYNDADKDSLSITQQLSGIISQWYYALRNLAIVGLLCILVYVGIRMIISSTASDKAKYKEMLKDWIVALCLLFVLHYIMAFTLEIINQFNTLVGTSMTSIPVLIHTDGWTLASLFQGDIGFKTDMMGLTRLQMQYDDATSKLVYMCLYIGLLVYTVRYTWIYMKRTITMMFLTLVSPIVALTYPIDKMNDGKAQAFNTWLKEFIYTALLQPFHLIMYTVLMGSAINIAVKNPIYAIMVLAFMGPAEKMLRKFFGFDKASTPGTLSQAGAMFGGAAAYKLLKGATGAIAKKAAGNGKGDNVRTKNNKPVEDVNAPEGYNPFAGDQIPDTLEGRERLEGEGEEQERREREQRETEERERIRSQLDNADYNDMYLNPELYQGMQDRLAELDARREQEQERREQERKVEEQLEQPQAQPRIQKIRLENPQGQPRQEMETPQPQDQGQPQPGPQPPQSGNRWRNVGRKAWQLYRAPSRAAGKALGDWKDRHFGDAERTKRTLKSAAITGVKVAGKAAAYTAMGAVGVGLGIGGEDIEDVLTLGAAGATLGGSVASSIGSKIVNSGIAQSIGIESHQVMHGGSVNQAEVAAQTERLYETGEIRDWAQDTFVHDDGSKPTGEELNELEDRAIGHYNAGFTDASERKKVMKFENKLRQGINAQLPEQERDEKSKVMAQTIGKLARDIQPGKLSSEDYRKGKIDEFKRGIKKANQDLPDSVAEQNAKQMMEMIMTFYKKP